MHKLPSDYPAHEWEKISKAEKIQAWSNLIQSLNAGLPDTLANAPTSMRGELREIVLDSIQKAQDAIKEIIKTNTR